MAEITLSGLFLVAVISWAATTKAGPLRGSTIATLCALDEPTRQSLGHIGNYEDLRRRGVAIQVKLVDGPDGLALRSVS